MRGRVAALALAASLVACSSSEDAGAPPPSADEMRAVEEARSMVPDAEPSSTGVTPEEAKAIKENPAVNPTLKPGYETPLPGAQKAE
jgi:hypothetical protein